jgi:hypothetical protein
MLPLPSKHRLSNAGSKPQLKSQKPSDGLASLCIQPFNFIQETNETARCATMDSGPLGCEIVKTLKLSLSNYVYILS